MKGFAMIKPLAAIRGAFFAATAALAVLGAQAAELATKHALTLEIAKQMSAAAEAEAVENGWTVVIAIVDEGGRLMHLVRRDGTQYGSIEVAQDKARTAIAFRRPTKALEDAVAGGRNAVLRLGDATPIEGGIPIVVDGEMLGAIGVSGATSAQDAQVAQAGIDALPAILR
jgi:glc operon protein GlcG